MLMMLMMLMMMLMMVMMMMLIKWGKKIVIRLPKRTTRGISQNIGPAQSKRTFPGSTSVLAVYIYIYIYMYIYISYIQNISAPLSHDLPIKYHSNSFTFRRSVRTVGSCRGLVRFSAAATAALDLRDIDMEDIFGVPFPLWFNTGKSHLGDILHVSIELWGYPIAGWFNGKSHHIPWMRTGETRPCRKTSETWDPNCRGYFYWQIKSQLTVHHG